jgi:hypothetical protein
MRGARAIRRPAASGPGRRSRSAAVRRASWSTSASSRSSSARASTRTASWAAAWAGVVGALGAAGLRARDILVARGFRFPRPFIPSGLAEWETVFGSAAKEAS